MKFSLDKRNYYKNNSKNNILIYIIEKFQRNFTLLLNNSRLLITFKLSFFF